MATKKKKNKRNARGHCDCKCRRGLFGRKCECKCNETAKRLYREGNRDQLDMAKSSAGRAGRRAVKKALTNPARKRLRAKPKTRRRNIGPLISAVQEGLGFALGERALAGQPVAGGVR